jgi:hypothetical protein
MLSPEGEWKRAVDSGFSTTLRGSASSLKASSASTPVQCTGSPNDGCSSTSVTE